MPKLLEEIKRAEPRRCLWADSFTEVEPNDAYSALLSLDFEFGPACGLVEDVVRIVGKRWELALEEEDVSAVESAVAD